MGKWLEDDEKIAIGLITEGKTYNEIAAELGRTPKSVKLKLNRLGYTFNDFKEVDKKVIKCLKCDKEFEVSKNSERKFCSHSCSASYNNSKRVKTHKKCKTCGKEIKGRDKRSNIFCDHKCHKEYEWEEKKKKIKKGLVSKNTTLRKYKIKEEGHICKICKSTEWNGKDIPLVLDHIDGNPYNNLPSNLRMICHNCDAQTDTYKGKNIGKGRHERRKRYHEGKSY